jgi:hypothetical protein
MRSLQRSAYTSAARGGAVDDGDEGALEAPLGATAAAAGEIKGLKTGRKNGVVLVRAIIIFNVSPSICSSLQ